MDIGVHPQLLHLHGDSVLPGEELLRDIRAEPCVLGPAVTHLLRESNSCYDQELLSVVELVPELPHFASMHVRVCA